ncbi:MAG: sulfatase-like hydrolase/transferase [Verrucomicrobia bacterium]|nr:sulfatase-like hydrolase/transferase [Verrucomicrobiota bacterium]
MQNQPSAPAAPLSPSLPPNILIITANQLSQRALGAYGRKDSHAPNIDRLARRGVTFANAYTPCPLCMPARAAMWTSRLPHDTGIRTNSRTDSVATSLPTLGDVFSQAGYRCVHVGKTNDCGALRGFELLPGEAAPVEATPPWTNYRDSECDRHTAIQAESFLKEQGAAPYVMIAEFNNPHDVCLWVDDHSGAHADTPVPSPLPALPENFETTDLDTRPLAVRFNCCSNFRVAQTLAWTPENFRHYLAAYDHYTDMLDRDVARVLTALARRPDATNTIVVFLADHGDGLASHRLVTVGGNFYEEAARVPFMISGPGIVSPRTPTRAPLVSLLDLFPTLCDCSGIPAPAGLVGRSLRPWLRGRGPRDAQTHTVSTWTGHAPALSPGRMIRSHRFKYTHYREDNAEELFDLVADPKEMRNLATDPDHAEQLTEHRALLQTHCAQTGDPYFAELVTVTAPAHAHAAESCPCHAAPAT